MNDEKTPTRDRDDLPALFLVLQPWRTPCFFLPSEEPLFATGRLGLLVSVLPSWRATHLEPVPGHRRSMPSFSAQAQIDEVMKQVKEKLQARSSSVMAMFHSMDKDQSQQLTSEEFKACLKEFGIVLPGHTMAAFIAQFECVRAAPRTSTTLHGVVGRVSASARLPHLTSPSTCVRVCM